MQQQTIVDKKVQEYLQNILKKIKADYAEIRAEESIATRIIFKADTPETIIEPFSSGFFIRILINGAWGITTCTDIKALPVKIEQAIYLAKIQKKSDIKLAPTTQHKAIIDTPLQKDFRSILLSKKVALIKDYSKRLYKNPYHVQTSNVIYMDTYLTKYFINSYGANILQHRPYVRLAYSATAKNNDVIEMYRGSTGHIGGYEIVEGLEENMEKVAKEANELVKCPKVKSGKYTVILDPYIAGTFAHEAFGHFSEADHQYENPKLLEQMAIGKKIGSDEVTIIDDPMIPNGWGNFVFDDEGVLGKRVQLLTQGVITGRLHSLETAASLHEMPNGRARADGFSSKPIVRMSNTFFQPGKHTFKDMIATTQKGIYVINWIAGMTALENFTFTGMYGIMIENGKLTQKVRGVKLMGNVFETLKDIDAVSSDFDTDQGTCGKEGQYMPVGSGGGYVRIHNMTVGGE